MSERRELEHLERLLREEAARFAYPPTPDIARAVRRLTPERGRQRDRPARRWRSVAVVVALVLLVLLAVPEVRAGLRVLLQFGPFRFVPAAPTAGPPPMAPTAGPAPGQPTVTVSRATPPATRTPPRPTPGRFGPPLDLIGRTTLDAARQRVPFRLPTYPPGIGPPDAVFVQELAGRIAILVWLEPGTTDRVRFSLHVLTDDVIVQKTAGMQTELRRTTVSGHDAVWVRGPHLLETFYQTRRRGERRQVLGNVLIWQQDGLYYRLEVPEALPFDQARRIAESLR